MARANAVVTTTWDDRTRTFTFGVAEAGTFEFRPDDVAEAVADRARLHGFVQRISDGAAMSRNTETGLPATPAEKFARMKAIADHLQTSETWAMAKGVGGGRKADDGGLVVMAMVRAGLVADVNAANAAIADLAIKRGIDRKEAVKLFAGTPEVQVAIGQIKGERAKTDAAGLMAELMG